MSQFDRDAEQLARQYESVSFEQVHRAVLDLIPPRPARLLDVGAGSGRDAAALAIRGHAVTAVEPSTAMRQGASTLHPGLGIEWIDDSLPWLASLRNRGGSFDLILVSAVWMYLDDRDRETAIEALTDLLAPDGLLIVSLRHGATRSDAVGSDVPDDEVLTMARRHGLDRLRQTNARDALERSALWWTTLVFQKRTADVGDLR